MRKNKYRMSKKVWLYPGIAHSTRLKNSFNKTQDKSGHASSGQGGWHFVSVPKKLSAEIKTSFDSRSKGWGSLPVLVTVGKTSWKTSIFPDKKAGAYLLPLKADIRKKEKICDGDTIRLTLEFR